MKVAFPKKLGVTSDFKMWVLGILTKHNLSENMGPNTIFSPFLLKTHFYYAKTGGQTDYYPLQLVDTHIDGRLTGNYDPFLEYNKISIEWQASYKSKSKSKNKKCNVAIYTTMYELI